MNILITGGGGFIGKPLTRELQKSGHKVLITTRQESDSPEKITWNPPEHISPDIMSNIDAVINLAGESIAPNRWTTERKKLILSSRTDTTRALVESIERADPKPKTLISASAIGYYGPHGNEYVTEDDPPASTYLADVCMKWEAEAMKAEALGLRVVRVRIGGVLEADGGALAAMVGPFKNFAGGPIGSGKQWFSWIHRDDLIGIFIYALEHEDVSGAVNGTAPKPVTNKEFSSALGYALHRPSYITTPGFVIKLALGELADILLTGQRVLPKKTLEAGFQFKYQEVNKALQAIFHDTK